MAKKKEKGPSPYSLLSRWILDGSTATKIPEDVVKSKAIGPQYLLYYFQASPYILYFSKVFNNYSLFQLDRLEIFRFIKSTVMKCGYKPPFIAKSTSTKAKIAKALRIKFPFLKYDEISLLVDQIDESEDKQTVYEMFGLYSPNKIKTKKGSREKIKKELEVREIKKEQESQIPPGITMDNLMGNFVIEEVS